jgi:hypothetical protein
MLTLTNKLLKALLNSAGQHVVAGNYSGGLYGAYVGLITNTPALTPNSVIGDMQEPTYTGYARQAIGAPTGPYQDQDGSWDLIFATLAFQMANATTPTNVTGWFIADALTAGNLLAAELFPTPIDLTTTDNVVPIAPTVELPPTADYGTGVIVS